MGILGTIIYNIKNMKKAKKFRTLGKEGLLALNDEDFYELTVFADAETNDIEIKALISQLPRFNKY